MTKFLYWGDEDMEVPTFEKIIKQPKLKGEYIREQDQERRERSYYKREKDEE